MLMGNIFENYSFDKRGISRGIAHWFDHLLTSKNQLIYHQ
jgi:hypothetical protein